MIVNATRACGPGSDHPSSRDCCPGCCGVGYLLGARQGGPLSGGASIQDLPGETRSVWASREKRREERGREKERVTRRAERGSPLSCRARVEIGSDDALCLMFEKGSRPKAATDYSSFATSRVAATSIASSITTRDPGFWVLSKGLPTTTFPRSAAIASATSSFSTGE